MPDNDTPKIKLINKITKRLAWEQNAILQSDPEKLIVFANEIAIKQRIVRLLPYLKISEEQCEYLLKQELPLDYIYNMCMDCMLDRVIDCACAKAICDRMDKV